jgi:hypothetical protein
METTKFYEELDKLRLSDPTSPTGKESDRALAKRLGIANKSITLYRYGTLPRADTIRGFTKVGGYNTETLHRLLGAAAGEQSEAKPISERNTPVYYIDDVGIDGVAPGAKPIFNIGVPMELNVHVSRSSLVGVKIDGNDVTCEPRVPRGSVVVYSNSPSDPENMALYVFCEEGITHIAMLRVRGRSIWKSNARLEDLKQITSKEYEGTVLGKVIMVYSIEINIPGVTDQ